MIVDSDMHVTEPPDIWSRAGLPIEGWGWTGLTIAGRRMPDLAPEWPTDDENRQHYEGLSNFHVEANERGWGPETTIAAMDREGTDIAVLFPTRAGWLVGADDLDPVLVHRACVVYNEWIASYCAAANKIAGRARVAAVGLVGLYDPTIAVSTAADAVQRLHLWGVATRPNPLGTRTLDHPDYDPFYAAVAGLDVPLILHEGTGALTATLGRERCKSRLEAHATSHWFEQQMAVLHFTVGGVFHRHPSLRVGFFEAGAGWLVPWLDRLDEHALGPFGAREYSLPMRPSRYFRRQGWVTFDTEELHGIEAEGLAGNVLFASDWPHGDGHHPHATREGRMSAGRLWSRITDANASAFWRPRPGAPT